MLLISVSLAYIAEKERLKIRSRCAEGIKAAKAKGVRFGRPPVKRPENWDEVIARIKSGEITATEGMKLLHLKKTTFYKLMKSADSESV